MAHSGDDFGRAADAMSAADLARIYPARRVMDPGTEPMSRRGFTVRPQRARTPRRSPTGATG